MQRILALDVGDKRIGIALSDPLGITAQGLETYTRQGEADARYIAQLLERHAPAKLVLGLPRNMDGSEGFQSRKVRDFALEIAQHYGGEIDFFDERLTTVMAEQALIETGADWKKRKKLVDKTAAVMILQGYLERIR